MPGHPQPFSKSEEEETFQGRNPEMMSPPGSG